MRHFTRGFKVAVDVDDVLVPCHERLCETASAVLGYFVDPTTTPHKIEGVVGEAGAKRVWDHIDSMPGWCAPPISVESANALVALRTIADELVAVTSPHTTGTWMPDRQRWLREQAGFKKDDIIQGSGKYHVDADVLIDDLPKNLIAYARRYPHAFTILFTSIENRNVHALPSPRSSRADGWDDVIRAVKRAKITWEHECAGMEHG